jgi:hypothetical protein
VPSVYDNNGADGRWCGLDRRDRPVVKKLFFHEEPSLLGRSVGPKLRAS